MCLIGSVSALAQPGIPSEPLSYSGTISEGAGPLQGNRDVTVRIYSAPTGGMLRCTAQTVTAEAAKQGRFEAPLGMECETAVRQNSELWVEVFVSGAGAMTRTRLRSVPTAITAQRSLRTISVSGTAQISSNGLLVRTSAGMYKGAWSFMGLTGYLAGKRICETDVGTPTAHVCTPDEANRSALLGSTVPRGWLMNMNGGGNGPLQGTDSANNRLSECSHHTSDEPGGGGDPGATLGLAWDDGSSGPAGVYWLWCQSPMPLLCCD